MGTGVSLAVWSELLLAEIFGDASGDGRPVTSILVDDDLLCRALVAGGVEVDGSTAHQMFLEAFPSRDWMVGWFGGSRNPGAGLIGFLVLCCYAAGEAADIDNNDYRGRLAEILGWPDRVTNCAALPGLWRRAEKLVASKHGMRPFKLPDPGVYRSQIGHAVELAFPSRPDTSKLRTLLSGRVFDTSAPREVLRFVGPLVFDGRLSASFRNAFTAFRSAFERGERALVDDRFWVGWRLVANHSHTRDKNVGFEVVADEWGGYRIVDPNDRPLDFRQIARGGITAPAAMRAIADGAPILLEPAGWGRWTWAGPGSEGARAARAALIRVKTYSASRLSAFDQAAVAGAEGWAFTRSIDLLLSADERGGGSRDGLFDAVIAGMPRVDGGILARPTFPVELRATAPIGLIEIVGDEADQIRIERLSPDIARFWFKAPLSANLKIKVGVKSGAGTVSRALRACGTVIAPRFVGRPDRLVDDEPPRPEGWSHLMATEPPRSGPLQSGVLTVPHGAIPDIVEFLAARPGPIPLGEFLEILGAATKGTGVATWDVLRAFLEAGVLDPLRNRAWRGRAILAAPPSAVLRATSSGWIMVLAGLSHEVAISRFIGRAESMGLDWESRPGLGEWAPVTLFVQSARLDDLRVMAADLGLPTAFWMPDLKGMTPLATSSPDADGSNHVSQQRVMIAGAEALSAAGIELRLCQGENNDRAPVWAVVAPGRSMRFWRLRHEAILDACAEAGAHAFAAKDGVLRRVMPGAHPPLAAARWLRFLACTASGPTGGEYAYHGSSIALQELRGVLGPVVTLTETRRSSSLDRLVTRSTVRGRSLARPASVGVSTLETWRWARDNDRSMR